MARARLATESYKRLENAIAAGFRKVGPDMPNMGEHWIQVRRVMQRSLRPEEPSTLTYVRIGGVPVLTGVAYTIPVQAGERVPPVPIEGVDWHFHAGTIHEELMGHHHSTDGARLAMMHAWIWAENPAGVFSADNWGLSFIRLELPIPEDVAPAASKALFLLAGGVDYFAELFESTASTDDLRPLLEKYRSRVANVVENDAASSATLAALWQDLLAELHAEENAR